MGQTSNTDNLRAGIDQTRDDIGRTLEEIGDRLNPRTVARDAAESMKDAAISMKDRAATKAESVMSSASDRAGELMDQAREALGPVGEQLGAIGDQLSARPWAAILVAAGVGWGAYRALRGGRDTERDGYSPRWYEEGDFAANDEPSQGDRLASRVTRVGRRAPHEFTRIIRENPLLVGIAAAAIGAAIGMSIPETAVEREVANRVRESALADPLTP